MKAALGRWKEALFLEWKDQDVRQTPKKTTRGEEVAG